MSDVASLIADMVRAGVDPELIGRTAAALSQREAVVIPDEAAERRRAADRERKRLRKSAEIVGSSGTTSPDKEIPPIPPKEINPTTVRSLSAAHSPAPTPRSELETVLDGSRAGAVLDHRQRIRKPLTAHAAKLLAGKFAKCPDPNAAADAMIGNGWQGFEPEWLDRPTARGSPPPLRGLEAVAARLRRDIENEQRQNGTEGLDLQDDERLPLLTGPRH